MYLSDSDFCDAKPGASAAGGPGKVREYASGNRFRMEPVLWKYLSYGRTAICGAFLFGTNGEKWGWLEISIQSKQHTRISAGSPM